MCSMPQFAQEKVHNFYTRSGLTDPRVREREGTTACVNEVRSRKLQEQLVKMCPE